MIIIGLLVFIAILLAVGRPIKIEITHKHVMPKTPEPIKDELQEKDEQQIKDEYDMVRSINEIVQGVMDDE